MFKRILKLGAAAGLVLVVVVIATGGGGRVPALVAGWCIFGYLVVRGWPGIRSDVVRLAGSAGRRSPVGRRVRGDVL